MTLLRKLRDILSPREQRRFAGLILAIVAVAAFEVAGLVSVLPFMYLASEPAAIENNAWLRAIYDRFGFTNPSDFLLAAGAGVLLLLVLSNGARAWVQWYQLRVTWTNAHHIATRLFSRFARQPYAFFLGYSSADLARQVVDEVNLMVHQVIRPLIELVARGLVSLALVVVLFVADPGVALTVLLVLGASYGAIYLLTRTYVSRLGRKRYAANKRRYRAAIAAFRSVKSIKLAHEEAFFEARFAEANHAIARVYPRYLVVSSVPRYAIEVVAFGGIVAIVLYLLQAEGDLGSLLPLLTLYAIAGYRLLPASQSIYQSLNALRYNTSALDAIHQDFTERTAPVMREEASPGRQGFERIEASGLSYAYPGTSQLVLRDIDVRIPKGSSIAFVGPTGSGKTTLVDLLTGLLEPTAGAVRVDGRVLTGDELAAWQRGIGYVPQDVLLYDDTIARNIAFGHRDDEIDHARLRAAARTAQIDAFIERELPEGYDTIVGENGIRLSGGQRQRIGLARAFYREPHLLILDEATSALDGITEQAVMEAIQGKDRSVTVVMIAHRLTTVKDCDLIYVLEAGRIVDAGRYEHLLASSGIFRQMAKVV